MDSPKCTQQSTVSQENNRRKSLLLVDYYGTCDRKGAIYGHSMKALAEYAGMAGEAFELGTALAPCYADYVKQHGELEASFQKVHRLTYNVVEEGDQSIRRRIADKFHLFHNIREVYSLMNSYDVVWFYRVDFFLFFYFALHPLKRRHYRAGVACLIYQDYFTGGKLEGVLQWFYRKGRKSADLMISTSRSVTEHLAGSFYMPDFTYDPAIYESYRSLPKRRRAVCLGAMSPYKQLEPLIDSFRHIPMELVVRGKFYEPERAARLAESAPQNVTVRNEAVPEEEYYRLLAGSRYAILPYDMIQYERRSSGILTECQFVGTIPVAPQALLTENGLPGIGYQSLADLPGIFADPERSRKDQQILDQMDPSEYDREKVRTALTDRLACLGNGQGTIP